jgi:hypothetical protein
MNQFRRIHSGPLLQSVTLNCVEPPSATICHPDFSSSPSLQRPNAVCLLYLLCALIYLGHLMALGVEGEEHNIILANTYRLFPPCWQNDTKNVIKFSMPCALCSTLSIMLFPTHYLTSISLIIVLTVKVTVPILQVTVRDAQRYTVFIAYYKLNLLQTKINFVLL